MTELNLFPSDIDQSTQLLIAHFDADTQKYGLEILPSLRKLGISSEIYPDIAKLKKQLNYANRKNIPFVVVLGSEEVTSGQLTLKDMSSGEQHKGSLQEVADIVNAS